MPDSSDDYQLPSWPPTPINRDLWNAVMGSIGQRLTAREELEADFEALIAQGTQASLDYIQATVAPQIANLQTTIELAQEQIDQIVIDGIAPNAAKLGGQLPAHYATAAALALKADVTYVDSELLDRATAIHLLLDQKAGATETTEALSKRTRVDAPQSLTQAERGQARANIGAGVLAGFRNKIINGDFDVWQRGTSLAAGTTFRYCADRWLAGSTGSTISATRIAAPVGTSDVPGNPSFFARFVVASSSGSGNYAAVQQRIEGARTLSGRRATLTFWAKSDAPRNMAVDFEQSFGFGGSPSAAVTGIGATKVTLSTAWQKFSVVVDLPSIAGKLYGTGGNDYVSAVFWFDAGSSFNSRASSLGHQSGTFDIAHVSLVEGDATAEDDPFSPRNPQQERDICERHFEIVSGGYSGPVTTGNGYWGFGYPRVQKRTTPTVSWYRAQAVFRFHNSAPTIESVMPDGGISFRMTANGTGDGAYAVHSFFVDAEL